MNEKMDMRISGSSTMPGGEYDRVSISGSGKMCIRDRYVEAAFYGLRPASTAMVAAAGLSVVAITLLNTGATGLAIVNWKALALAAVILALTRWVKPTKGLHPIVFILASAVVGVVFSF